MIRAGSPHTKRGHHTHTHMFTQHRANRTNVFTHPASYAKYPPLPGSCCGKHLLFRPTETLAVFSLPHGVCFTKKDCRVSFVLFVQPSGHLHVGAWSVGEQNIAPTATFLVLNAFREHGAFDTKNPRELLGFQT